MSYSRVIPRDFFNEAKLLKCYGQLSLAILDGKVPKGITIAIEETGESFEIALSDDGSLYVSNYEILVNGCSTTFGTRYNSKRNYPFYCQHSDTLEEIEVFDENGEFTSEFKTEFYAATK